MLHVQVERIEAASNVVGQATSGSGTSAVQVRLRRTYVGCCMAWLHVVTVLGRCERGQAWLWAPFDACF